MVVSIKEKIDLKVGRNKGKLEFLMMIENNEVILELLFVFYYMFVFNFDDWVICWKSWYFFFEVKYV